MGETLPSHCLLFINHHSRRCSTEDNKQFLSISKRVQLVFYDSNRQKVNVEVTFPTSLKVIFRFKVRTCPRSVKDTSMQCF